MNKILLNVQVNKDLIIIGNQRGKTKTFPRWGIILVKLFVKDMAKSEKLDDLLFDDAL